MINFDAVDFSERRPEEVISFFWCSVYKHNQYSTESWVKIRKAKTNKKKIKKNLISEFVALHKPPFSDF